MAIRQMGSLRPRFRSRTRRQSTKRMLSYNGVIGNEVLGRQVAKEEMARMVRKASEMEVALMAKELHPVGANARAAKETIRN